MKLLLLSNSKSGNEPYLYWAESHIKTFLGELSTPLIFVPYAGVTISWDDYYSRVKDFMEALGYQIHSLHNAHDPERSLKSAGAVVVGGGNTFHLLHTLQELHLMRALSRSVHQGLPYIGWSAGSNLACPTIATTNDMPVVSPKNLKGLHLVPFQINPHYTEKLPPGHGGESRSDRIKEFITLNKNISVIGLREGTGILMNENTCQLIGYKPARLFKFGLETQEIIPGNLI
ncbi:MAG: dipeptidase PepE [Candidatus Neomarinimicrobiota bacterium]